MLLTIAFGGPGHVPYLQIFNTDERVVFADHCSSFMQEIFSGISDVRVNLLYLGFSFLPVTTEFNFTTHAPLVTCQTLLMLFEAI